MITKERKDEIILSLRKFIVDNDDKVALYDEIYHHIEELVPRRVPRGEVLQEKESSKDALQRTCICWTKSNGKPPNPKPNSIMVKWTNPQFHDCHVKIIVHLH
jgi:hypothetical protein